MNYNEFAMSYLTITTRTIINITLNQQNDNERCLLQERDLTIIMNVQYQCMHISVIDYILITVNLYNNNVMTDLMFTISSTDCTWF